VNKGTAAKYWKGRKQKKRWEEGKRQAYFSHISATIHPNFVKFYANVAYGCGSVLLCRSCNTLCTSGFVDDVSFSCNRSYCDVTIAAASLQCRACPNTPAECYYMRPVVYDCGANTRRVQGIPGQSM